LNSTQLKQWPSEEKIAGLNKNKIYYALVNNGQHYVRELMKIVYNKNSVGLPEIPIPPEQVSIAGGFFVSHEENIEWWRNTYDAKLKLYFENNYLVKDDQIIIVDCVFSNMSKFHLCKEEDNYDNWFLNNSGFKNSISSSIIKICSQLFC
jgi:hypothetical protein